MRWTVSSDFELWSLELLSTKIICILSYQPMKVKVTQSCPTVCDPMDWLYSPWNSPGQNTGVGSLSLLQEIFPTQGSNPGLLHCRWILYQLSHKGSPRILEWVAYPFSSRFSRPRNQTGVSCIAGRFFTYWAIRKASSAHIWTIYWVTGYNFRLLWKIVNLILEGMAVGLLSVAVISHWEVWTVSPFGHVLCDCLINRKQLKCCASSSLQRLKKLVAPVTCLLG